MNPWIQRSDARQVNRIDDPAADQVGIAEYQRVRSLIDLARRAGQNIFAVVVPRLILPSSHVTEQHRVFFALLVIDTGHRQILTRIAHASECRQAARIGGSRKAWIIDKRQSLRRKEFRIDRIPRKPVRTKWRSQCNVLIALTGWRCEVGEVTGEHFRSRNEGPVDRRRRTLDRRLLSDEEEDLVLYYRSAESAA